MTPTSASGLTVLSTVALLAASGCGGTTGNASPGTGGDAGGSQDSGLSSQDASGDASQQGVDAATGVDSATEAGAGVLAIPMSSCTPTVYTATTTIGTQPFQLLVDTGSTTLGVAANGCSCGGVTPAYTPGASAVDQKQMASSQYGSGSWTGEIYQDDVVVGASPMAPTKVVAIGSQTNFFNPIQCDSTSGGMQGILGLGPSAAALQGTTGFFDQLVADAHVPDVFATKLCDTDGTLWLGGFDPAATTAMPQYTPSNDLYSTYYYTVKLASITVGTTAVPVGAGQYTDAVVDTGTSVFLLGTTAYNGLVSALEADAQVQALLGATFFPPSNTTTPTCRSLTQTKAQLDAMLPELAMTFGSNPGITVKAVATESYLFSYGGQWCTAMAGLDQGPTTFPFAAIMGSPVLRSNVVIFDRANKQIGFAPHTPCP